jgi:hypothetical protein
MTIKEATNGGPLAQPAAFRVVTPARRPRSRPRGRDSYPDQLIRPRPAESIKASGHVRPH